MLLTMCGHYDRDPGLDQYIMALVDEKQGQINEWSVTSSHVNGQQRGDQHTRGGLIPPVHHVRRLDKWEVMLIPEDSRHVKGVEGNFYRIMPYEVTTKSGGKRSALGIHRDANLPGSMGCIVMDQRNFDDFEETMAWVRETIYVDRLPLFPFYS